MTTFEIRVRADATGYYARYAGETIGTLDTREEAESVVAAALNGAEWEVVETPGRSEK